MPRSYRRRPRLGWSGRAFLDGQIYGCLVGCAAGDSACSSACYEQGTATAQDQLDAMNGCFDSQCASIVDDEAWLDCVYSSCAGPIESCFPPDRCDLRGGDCPSGTACYPTRTGASSCYGSRGAGAGQTCQVEPGELLECADGLLCIGAGAAATGTCRRFCLGAGTCDAGDSCEIPVFEGLDGVGVCLCTDADADGACQADDCDNADPARRPDAEEQCGDRLDNNCDGRVDEGCRRPQGANYGDGSLGGDDGWGLCSGLRPTSAGGVAWGALALAGLLGRRRRGR